MASELRLLFAFQRALTRSVKEVSRSLRFRSVSAIIWKFAERARMGPLIFSDVIEDGEEYEYE